jgi:hypothetical protein
MSKLEQILTALDNRPGLETAKTACYCGNTWNYEIFVVPPEELSSSEELESFLRGLVPGVEPDNEDYVFSLDPCMSKKPIMDGQLDYTEDDPDKKNTILVTYVIGDDNLVSLMKKHFGMLVGTPRPLKIVTSIKAAYAEDLDGYILQKNR